MKIKKKLWFFLNLHINRYDFDKKMVIINNIEVWIITCIHCKLIIILNPPPPEKKKIKIKGKNRFFFC